jgi:CheY-like chemotaxis protein/anti-sigma regulatory factor (Ser/Thr protein kinase)
MEPAAAAKGVKLVTELDPAASLGLYDIDRMQQVVWNLLSNAIKFTPPGGTVIVRLSKRDTTALIEVKDTGTGMSPEFLPYVFDRFRQADTGTRRRSGGLGLGLSIVKHIVELHGGTVEVQSEGEGKGSTFTILLPVRAVRVKESDDLEIGHGTDENADMSRSPKVNLSGLHLLVVDDDTDARRLLTRVLEEAGAAVTTAASVAEAMELIEKVAPDVLLSDLGMPNEDGYDLIRQVRRSGYNSRKLPAVALTAFAGKEHEHRALLAGFQRHISKPVESKHLVLVVASLAGRTDDT